MKTHSLIGKTFNRMIVISEFSRIASGRVRQYANCLCDCGNEKTILRDCLLSGDTQSCGCLQAEMVSQSNTTHGDYGTKEYRTWRSMLSRCYNQSHIEYQRYGGKGIVVCEEWKTSYEAFLSYIGRCPTPQHSIDRYPDNDGHYEPGNVRWATNSQQCRNRSSNRILIFQGKAKCLSEWADDTGISEKTIGSRLRLGWPVERILTTPARRKIA